MIGYAKHFESNKTMLFKISDNKLLKKYIEIWIDNEPACCDSTK